jgi:cob(I)alamin adenosyltransferase
MKIYTKTGDAGDTGLFGGGRVPKDDVRVEAYGDVDELNAVIGVVRANKPDPRTDDLLLSIQRDLFSIGALLATPDRAKMEQHLSKASLDEKRIEELERAIDACDAELDPLKSFILPGGDEKAAALHFARTVCRRAERRIVALDPPVAPVLLRYVNRLSDLLFVLARTANHRGGVTETEWN